MVIIFCFKEFWGFLSFVELVNLNFSIYFDVLGRFVIFIIKDFLLDGYFVLVIFLDIDL